jgi:hypothetical protein
MYCFVSRFVLPSSLSSYFYLHAHASTFHASCPLTISICASACLNHHYHSSFIVSPRSSSIRRFIFAVYNYRFYSLQSARHARFSSCLISLYLISYFRFIHRMRLVSCVHAFSVRGFSILGYQLSLLFLAVVFVALALPPLSWCLVSSHRHLVSSHSLRLSGSVGRGQRCLEVHWTATLDSGLQVVIVYCSIMLSIDECILYSRNALTGTRKRWFVGIFDSYD